MSMQRVANYGSFLQAYGLKRILESLGYDVQFADFEPGEVVVQDNTDKNKYRSLSRLITPEMRILIHSIKGVYSKRSRKVSRELLIHYKYERRFKEEYNSYLGITRRKNAHPKVDILLIGSDEVFNCLQSSEKIGFSRDLFGMNNNSRVLASYAASFGSATLSRIEHYGLYDEIREMLSRFDCLSVRDENSFEIIRKMLNTIPCCHLDPVLIYDYNHEIIEKQLPYKYVLVYAYYNRLSIEEIEAIRAFAIDNNLKTLCVGVFQSFCDYYIDANPFELLGYVKNASYVISDTFHGCVFSIKFNINFAAIVRDNKDSHYYCNSQKVVDLMKRFDIEDLIVSKPEQLNNIRRKRITWDKINGIIESSKKETYKYLKSLGER